MGAMGSGGAVPMRYMAGGAGAGTAGAASAPGQPAPRTARSPTFRESEEISSDMQSEFEASP